MSKQQYEPVQIQRKPSAGLAKPYSNNQDAQNNYNSSKTASQQSYRSSGSVASAGAKPSVSRAPERTTTLPRVDRNSNSSAKKINSIRFSSSGRTVGSMSHSDVSSAGSTRAPVPLGQALERIDREDRQQHTYQKYQKGNSRSPPPLRSQSPHRAYKGLPVASGLDPVQAKARLRLEIYAKNRIMKMLEERRWKLMEMYAVHAKNASYAVQRNSAEVTASLEQHELCLAFQHD